MKRLLLMMGMMIAATNSHLTQTTIEPEFVTIKGYPAEGVHFSSHWGSCNSVTLKPKNGKLSMEIFT
jgi:hypothetical protein